jgi:transcription factor-like protein
VQSSVARAEIANRAGLYGILARIAAPMEPQPTKCDYAWLLHGTEKESRKIVGSTGLSSRLLHMYAQITHLTGKYQQNPKSTLLPAAGRVLESRLRNFWQWSDLSNGYTTSEELMSSCAANLNEEGKVGTIREVTELTAESFVAAAQIYLHCRLFKKPRSHPDVQEPIERLFKCTAWMPHKGSLFTAQAPLLPAWIAGIIASTPEQRDIVRDRFETVIGGSRGVCFSFIHEVIMCVLSLEC